MSTTLVERRDVLDSIVQRYIRQRNAITGSVASAIKTNQLAQADLEDIPTSLKQFLDDIANDAAANPDSLSRKLMAEEALQTLQDVSTLAELAASTIVSLQGIK